MQSYDHDDKRNKPQVLHWPCLLRANSPLNSCIASCGETLLGSKTCSWFKPWTRPCNQPTVGCLNQGYYDDLLATPSISPDKNSLVHVQKLLLGCHIRPVVPIHKDPITATGACPCHSNVRLTFSLWLTWVVQCWVYGWSLLLSSCCWLVMNN